MSTSITIKEYFAVEGSKFSNKDARIIGPELEALSQDGVVTARQVLEAAKKPDSPLHPYFEWNDQIAAGHFRRDQARKLLQSIKIKYADDSGLHEARAFHIEHVENQNQYAPRRFRSFQVLHGESAFAAQMMKSAMDDLQSWRRKYETYLPVWENFSRTFQVLMNQIAECEDEIVHPNLPAFTDEAIEALLEWKLKFIDAARTWDAWLEQMKYMIEAIREAEKVFCVESTVKHRDCIKCNRSFLSLEAGNRICRSCMSSKAIENASGSLNATLA